MANAQSGNVWYVDSTGILSANDRLIVECIIITPDTHGTGNPTVTIQDNSPSNTTKIRLATVNTQSLIIPLKDSPMDFFGGIKVSEITDAVVTIIIKRS